MLIEHILQKRGQFDTFKIKDPKINEYWYPVKCTDWYQQRFIIYMDQTRLIKGTAAAQKFSKAKPFQFNQIN